MPRMPRGIIKREGRGYYLRKRINGKPRWISLGTDPDEAKRKLVEGRVSVTATVRATVAQVADRWLRERIQVTRAEESAIKARTRVRLYLVPFLGHKLIGKLTREDLWAYRRWLDQHDREPSPQSVHHMLTDARCLLRWCEDEGILDQAPFPTGHHAPAPGGA